ncbi:MAG: twin-arginine translocase TatA/TatE family subunit [Firmicutes bacterium]|nr:twin-arginine translocase TatA/TatE family subunit [Bacillota bacterium]
MVAWIRPGFWEILLIFMVALLIFGPTKLPQIGRSLGKGIRELRSASREIKDSISLDEEQAEEKS